jgi:hypothetical protein
MSATFVGYVATSSQKTDFLKNFMKFFWKLIVAIIIFGLLWQ